MSVNKNYEYLLKKTGEKVLLAQAWEYLEAQWLSVNILEGLTLLALTSKSAGPKMCLNFLFFLKCLNNKIFLISLYC